MVTFELEVATDLFSFDNITATLFHTYSYFLSASLDYQRKWIFYISAGKQICTETKIYPQSKEKWDL